MRHAHEVGDGATEAGPGLGIVAAMNLHFGVDEEAEKRKGNDEEGKRKANGARAKE